MWWIRGDRWHSYSVYVLQNVENLGGWTKQGGTDTAVIKVMDELHSISPKSRIIGQECI